MNQAYRLGTSLGTTLRRWTWRQWAIAACLVILLWSLGAFITGWNDLHNAARPVAVPDAPRAPIPHINSFEDDRRQAVNLVALKVKGAARDPASVVFEDALTNDAGTVVCLQYRAKNGFGGMNREFVVLADSKTSQSVDVWNKRCAGRQLNDMLYAAKEISRLD